MRPRVSLGLPVYNGEEFLAETLKAIQKQTFADFELIISDNASTDSTEAICREFAAQDDRIRYSRNGRNVGLVRNFNVLQQLASGEYFKWAAHDDLLSPDYLERCVHVLDTDGSAVMVSPRPRLVDARGQPLPFDEVRRSYVAPHGELVPPIPSSPATHADSALTRFRAVVLDLTSSLANAYTFGLFRAETLAESHLFVPYVGSEKVLLAQIALKGKLVEITDELFAWRIHPGHAGTATVTQTKQMDPTWTGRMTFMGPRQIGGYLKVISRASVPPHVKLACIGVLFEKVAHATLKRGSRKARGIRARSESTTE
jgi:glycosyltransferase involved in cell wall biosynthesis